MRLAAILLGVVAGLAGLFVGLVGEALIQTIGGGAKADAQLSAGLSALFYGPPTVMLIGAVATIWWRVAGGVLLLAAAASWAIVGPNIATLGPIALAALAGILALLSAGRPKTPAAS